MRRLLALPLALAAALLTVSVAPANAKVCPTETTCRTAPVAPQVSLTASLPDLKPGLPITLSAVATAQPETFWFQYLTSNGEWLTFQSVPATSATATITTRAPGPRSYRVVALYRAWTVASGTVSYLPGTDR